jgi:hypothetical protein
LDVGTPDEESGDKMDERGNGELGLVFLPGVSFGISFPDQNIHQ